MHGLRRERYISTRLSWGKNILEYGKTVAFSFKIKTWLKITLPIHLWCSWQEYLWKIEENELIHLLEWWFWCALAIVGLLSLADEKNNNKENSCLNLVLNLSHSVFIQRCSFNSISFNCISCRTVYLPYFLRFSRCHTHIHVVIQFQSFCIYRPELTTSAIFLFFILKGTMHINWHEHSASYGKCARFGHTD